MLQRPAAQRGLIHLGFPMASSSAAMRGSAALGT
jgi:hypothetical protein